jgi:spore germination protein PC
LKNKPPVHVEYHFDQLKVSRLEGTLNIGLTPQGVQSMEDLDLPVPGTWTSASAPVPGAQDEAMQRIRGLQTEAAEDVDRNLPAALRRLADQMKAPIDEPHIRLIVDDIKKQLNSRVQYYARTLPYPEQGSEEERTGWSRTVLDKTKRDVEIAISQYLHNLLHPHSEGRKNTS